MSADVLVLNRNFYAVHIANWKRALSLVYLDHARVVDEEYHTYSFDDWRELSQIIQDHSTHIKERSEVSLSIGQRAIAQNHSNCGQESA